MFQMSTIGRGVAVAAAAGLLSLGFATTASAEPNTDNPNTEEYWEAVLTDEGFVDVDCVKDDEDRDTNEWISDGDYLLVVLKAGSDESSEGDPDTVYTDVEEGDVLETDDGKDISHIIKCVGDEPSTSTPTPTKSSTPTPTSTRPTGPVVETDVPASGSSNLPVLLGGAAVLAGAGLVAGAMRRREGQH